MNKNQLAEALEIEPSLVDYHLHHLKQAGLIVTRSAAQNKEVLVFRSEDADLWDDEQLRILYGRRTSRTVALYLVKKPRATTREIAEAIGLTPATVRYHLRTLRDYDLVHQLGAGRSNLYEPDQALEDWVETVGDAFDRPWEPR